jgi:hypothetical protein
MVRIRMIGLALVAVFAMGAVAASSASAAKNGPHWWVCEKQTGGKFENSECSKEGASKTWESKELLGGETRKISFTSGVTKLKTAADLIECKKDKGTGEIIGGWPGTDKATITFEECKVVKPALGCEVRNVGGTFGTIVVSVNTELVYTGTKAQAENEEKPLGILFKSVGAGNKKFVELEFNGLCALAGTKKVVEATGEEHGPGIAGKAGVVCKIVEPAEAYLFVHEIECVEGAQQKFFYWEGGVIKEGKAELKLSGEVAEQVGSAKIEAENAAKEKIAYDARGK